MFVDVYVADGDDPVLSDLLPEHGRDMVQIGQRIDGAKFSLRGTLKEVGDWLDHVQHEWMILSSNRAALEEAAERTVHVTGSELVKHLGLEDIPEAADAF